MKKKKSQKKEIKEDLNIDVVIQYKLHNWSETLTYDEIQDTLFVVRLYSDKTNPESTFNPSDRIKIENWLKINDITKFIKASDSAARVYSTMLENEMYAREIIGMAYKHPSSH